MVSSHKDEVGGSLGQLRPRNEINLDKVKLQVN